MKFRIIATIVLIIFLIGLTAIFQKSSEETTEAPVESVQ